MAFAGEFRCSTSIAFEHDDMDTIEEVIFAIIFGVPLAIGALALFALPTIIAYRKDHPQKVAIAVLNLVGGFFFLAGWIAALIWVLIKGKKPLVSPN